MLRKKAEEYHSLILSLLFHVCDFIVSRTLLDLFRLSGVKRDQIKIRHLEIYLCGTTFLILLLIYLSWSSNLAGWILVILGSTRILQVISINAMSLLFGLRLLSPEVPDRERMRWHFIAIFFSVLDILFLYGFFYHFFNRLYGVLSVSPDSFFDHLYFAMITLMTVGYGDIVPLSALGKFLAISETFVGVFVFVFLVNSAVSRFQRHLE
ncbi:MAG: two pore domain potassium channel family protein [Deltaproteobacteria bacterium]|nr:two pore domain potassium channel family protein [Deltaproteobacteria bacterium]